MWKKGSKRKVRKCKLRWIGSKKGAKRKRERKEEENERLSMPLFHSYKESIVRK
jgi:hypothetical protein